MPTTIRRCASLVPVAACALAGCSGPSRLLEPLTGSAGERLTAVDFRAPGADAASPLSVAPNARPFDPPASPAGAPIPVRPTAAAGAAPAIDPSQIEVSVGAPDLTGASPEPVEGATLLDVKVGDVNGRPIFASEFFEPMEQRLIAEAAQKPRREWQRDVMQRIQLKLVGIIGAELLKSEALESIPQEQREVGLGRFMSRRREEVEALAGGSLVQAQQLLRESSGLTLEEYLASQQDEYLVAMAKYQMQQNIQVSGRDIRGHYERHYDAYNPSPTARLREIVVLSSQTQSVQAVQQALDSGVPFEEVAAGPLNTSAFRAQGGLREVPLQGDYAGANLLNNQALNEAAWGLEPGEWAGPITYGGAGILTAWIYLERVQTRGLSLYEAQIDIAETLRVQKTDQAFQDMIGRLSERASFTEADQMALRLLEIATARYYPPGQREPAATPGFTSP